LTQAPDEWQLVRERELPSRRVQPAPWVLPKKTPSDDVSSFDDGDTAPDFCPSPLFVSRWQRLTTLLHNCLEQELTYGRAFLFMPVFLGLGAIWWFRRPLDLAGWPIFLSCLVCGLLWLKIRFSQPVIAACLGISALLMAGMVLAVVETTRLDTIILDGPVMTIVRGRVLSSEPNASGNQRYVIAMEETIQPRLKRMPQQVALLARGKHTPFKPGDWIEGRARLSPPSGPALPGLNDFAQSSYFSGIGAIGYFYRPPVAFQPPPEALDRGLLETSALRFGDITESLRNTISDRIRFWVPGDAGAFGVAIVTGEVRGLSAKANNDLRVSGLAHIISISGLRMALAGGLFFVGIRRILGLVPGLAETWSLKKIAALGAIGTTTGYFWISGYAVAAQRSYLMMVIMLSAAFFDRPALSLRNTAIAALFVVVISPSQVMGPSLQMSFAATFALIAGFDLWRQRPQMPSILPDNRVLRPLKTLLKIIAGILLTSALGGVSTAMFSAAHFHRVGLHGLEANLLASPIIEMVVMPSAMMGVLLMPFGLEQWPLRAMGWGLDGVLMIGSYIANWGNGFTFGRFEWWFLPLSSVGLLVLTLLKTRLRAVGIVMIAFAFGYEAVKPTPRLPDLVITEDAQLIGILKPSGANAVTVATNKKRPPGFVYGQWASALDISDTISSETLPKPRAAKSAPKPKDKYAKKEKIEAPDALLDMMEALTKASARRDIFFCRSDGFCLAKLSNDWTVTLVQNRDYSNAACALSDLIVSNQSSSYAVCTPVMADMGKGAKQQEAQITTRMNADQMTQPHPIPADSSVNPSTQPHAATATSTPPAPIKTDTASKPNPSSGSKASPVLIDRDRLRQSGAMEITLAELSSRSLHMTTTFHGEQRPWTRHRYYDWRTNTYKKPDIAQPDITEPEPDEASDSVNDNDE
jgi:competence protein ComEC